ncbi:MAG TPA: FUSC family protein [Dyella sp.]|uniref:FUSC family protein n=1 Tax=Dyella sp. TaxID=1869338 RepID=UPI002B97A01A|nr:FUSC family protein [Dyella sp.]HTV85036.1 FUSC family protein [Dyella sp.]
MKMSMLRRYFRRTTGGVVTELRLVTLRGDRGKLCAQTVASVVFAVYLADIFNLKERWWVALSAYALIRASPTVVFRRCLERLAGTVIGASIGVLLATMASRQSGLTVVALSFVSGLGVYCMLGSPYSYSWVLGTVTAIMVLSDAVGVDSSPSLAVNRVLDVSVGVLATATISAASFSIERLLRRGPSSVNLSGPSERSSRDSFTPHVAECSRSTRIWQALQGAIAIALIGSVNHFHALPNFVQSMVSVIAVLLVSPLVLLNGHVEEAVHVRMFNRLLGCFCAVLFAAPLLPLIGDTPFLCLLVLGTGVWLAAHVQAGSGEVSYIGTQFGVGFIMIFVQDYAWSTDASAALQRLWGILVALLILTATMAAFSEVGRKFRLHGRGDV